MIQIPQNKLEELANLHYETIEAYLKDKSKGHNYTYFLKIINTHLNQNYDLKKIILAKPIELIDLKNICKTLSIKAKKEFECFNTLYKHFSYGYSDGKNSKYLKQKDGNIYNGLVFSKMLNIKVCPYCNRNFIYSLEKDRPSELDHFYPQKQYSLLAVSFYNLIPSCKTCNHWKKELEIGLNPYFSNQDYPFEGIKFTAWIKDSNFYYSEDSIELDFNLKTLSKEHKELFEQNINVLHLKELYNYHKDVVLEIIQKNIAYNESYIDSLFQQYEGTLFKNREDVMRLLSSNYINEEDLDKRPLAKLTKDISEELGLL